MAEYRIGSVRLTQNSATVIADSVAPNVPTFNLSVAVGNLFKRRYENAFYQVSNVVSATRMTISPAYAGTTGTGLDYVVVTDFTPNLKLPEQSSGDIDTSDLYTRAMRKIDQYLPSSTPTWIQDTAKHIRVSATAFNASGDLTSMYKTQQIVKVRSTFATASANMYSLVAATPTYGSLQTYVRLETSTLSATPSRFYYGPIMTLVADQINQSHVDWGTGSNQVCATYVPINDYSNIITAVTVEGALRELKQDVINAWGVTASVDRNWVWTASCFRASNDTFNASGNKTTIFKKNRAVKIRDATASYYSYVASVAYTTRTRVVLASQAIPTTPASWFRDSGNTATRIKLKNIAAFANDFFNMTYWINFTTGNLREQVLRTRDWVSSSRTVVASPFATGFTATPIYGDNVRFLKLS